MRRILPTAWAVLCVLGCRPGPTVRDVAVLQTAPLHTFNERELDVFLKWFAEKPLPMSERVAHLGRRTIGQPYRLFLLGEYPFELYDPDPMYCLAASDCVTFVEQTYAMALARDWPSFFRTLQCIRYKDGQVGLLTRNHFTEADWNINNAWLFDDVTEDVSAGEVRPMVSSINRAAFFAKFGVACNDPVQRFVSSYIPRERLPVVARRLRTADVVEIVRGTKGSQYVSHMGLIIRDTSGSAMLLHSTKPVVREEPLLQYVDRHPDILGIKVLRLSETKHDLVRRSVSPGQRDDCVSSCSSWRKPGI